MTASATGGSSFLPGGLANSLGVAHYIGVFLVMVLGASSMGVEYGWGTLRTALARGTGRWQFLGAKALSLVLLSAAGLLVVSLTVAISSLITASLTLGDGGGMVGSGQWSTAAVMFGKVVYGLVPFVILALFFTILTSSSSMGIAMSGAYYFAEFLLVRILGGLFDWFSNVTDYLLGANTTIWMTTTDVVTTAGSASLFDIGDPPGTLHAFLVLLIYVVVLGGVATWLFQRRDIAGARGRMMLQVLRLTRWELFKLRKRWMPWILLGIIVAITQLILWGNYAAYHNESIQSFFGSASFYSSSTQTEDGIVSIELTCNDVREGCVAEKLEALPEDFRQRRLNDVQEFSESCSGVAVREAFREIFVLPSSIVNGIGATHMIGVALVMILAASVPGSEYGWGTLRNALTRGVGRWQFLASKLLLLALVGVAALLVVSVLNAVSTLIAAAIPPDEAGGTVRLRRVVRRRSYVR